jgi:hypothetical protein
MRFLADEALYASAADCLRAVREWRDEPDAVDVPTPYHVYWASRFGRKQAFAVKSFLATHDPARSRLWLWLDAEHGDGDAELLAPLAPFVDVRTYDPAVEARDTPLDGLDELSAGHITHRRSNVCRLLLLYRYGGVYADMDTMFLRDTSTLLGERLGHAEFCYQWSTVPVANTAVLRLHRGSETARALLERCAERGGARPHDLFRFDDEAFRELDLLVLPCAFFDPAWMHVDGKDRLRGAPFSRFEDFFRPFDWRFRPRRSIRSFRDFFPGAFTYHWHNQWTLPEVERSYFGRFERELDRLLAERLEAGVRSCASEPTGA